MKYDSDLTFYSIVLITVVCILSTFVFMYLGVI